MAFKILEASSAATESNNNFALVFSTNTLMIDQNYHLTLITRNRLLTLAKPQHWWRCARRYGLNNESAFAHLACPDINHNGLTGQCHSSLYSQTEVQG
jgi:hypothetical protein